MPTLDQLAAGERGIIDSLDGTGVIVQRLMELGLTDGEEVELIAVAPLGDPLEIRIRGYQLSLRKSEARRVLLRSK